ncbi:conserved hypothetical protein [Uncinocarpus reesii 1704]|uniref:Carboxylic ester hydrolase n=1 Tax=Uncinocarpus reesii (strain UAMH 1704) TaxID=336963 RepID=C4JHG0_UNCRE|nr:uncharacterized protein UREG_01323 [Uncinocarpus reesii 1704]EEP76474.1 conserved hypothetical protein [Uncinocarpus reesii 1704]
MWLFLWRRKQVFLLTVCLGLSLYAIFLWSPSLATRYWHWPWLREQHLDFLPSWLHLLLSYLFASVASSVEISQGTVVGTVLIDSTLPRPIEAFLGIPYAQPPTGERRFKRPQPVKPSSDIIHASKYGKRKLPVAIYVHGGAFNSGSGLHDQILLFKWVQENIGAFGGDPNQVTLIGLSAGAHSIGHHVMHNSGQQLFSRAVLESGATTSRAVYPPDNPLHEKQFREFLAEARCSNLPENEIITCLQSKPMYDIARASESIFNHYNPSDRWAFQPVIDGEIIKDAPIKNWKSGKWNKVPILTGFNTHEGAPFVPSDMEKSEEFTDFFRALIPPLPASDTKILNHLYPDPLKHPESPYVDGRDIDVGAQYKRATAAYGQFAYICPVRQTAQLASEAQDAPVYLYHWALNKTVKGGASHGDQSEYEVYSPYVRRLSDAQEKIAGYIHAYFTSFITNGDPNKIQGKYADRPRWTPFKAKASKSVMVLGEGNDERAGGGHVGIAAQMADNKWSEKECEFWSDRSILTES